MQLHQWESAVQDLTTALANKPDEWTLLQRAEAYRLDNLFEKAVADFTSVFDMDPQSYQALLGRGMCQMELKQPDEALKDFSAAIAIDPRRAQTYVLRGSVFMQKKRWQLAVIDFRLASALDPYLEAPKRECKIALTHFKESKQSPLLVSVPVAPMKLPDTVPELLNLGYRCLKDRSLDEAIMCCSAVVKKDPSNVLARKYLAVAFLECGEPEQGVKQLTALNALSPLNARDQMLLGRALFESGRIRDAEQVLSRLVLTKPNYLEPKALLAQICLQNGDSTKARALCKEGLSVAKTPREKTVFEVLMNRSTEARPQ